MRGEQEQERDEVGGEEEEEEEEVLLIDHRGWRPEGGRCVLDTLGNVVIVADRRFQSLILPLYFFMSSLTVSNPCNPATRILSKSCQYSPRWQVTSLTRMLNRNGVSIECST